MDKILRSMDAKALLKAWPKAFPHLPAPETEAEALKTLHMARINAAAMTEAEKEYSRQWLADHDIVLAYAVGISVNSPTPDVKTAIHDAMRQAVVQAGDAAPEIVRAKMHEARNRERKGLGLSPKIV